MDYMDLVVRCPQKEKAVKFNHSLTHSLTLLDFNTYLAFYEKLSMSHWQHMMKHAGRGVPVYLPIMG